MWNRLNRTDAPSLPVPLADVKQHLRIEYDLEDDFISGLVFAAAGCIEGPNGAGLALTPQTWELRLDEFPHEIHIPLTPVRSVDAITYIDDQGAEQSVDPSVYEVDIYNSPARVMTVIDGFWPDTDEGINKVKVAFSAGYDSIPPDLKAAVLLIVGHLYENRENSVIGISATELPMGADSIINRYRVGRF